MHRSKNASLDHLVGEREQRWRHGEAKRLHCLDVDDRSNLVAVC